LRPEPKKWGLLKEPTGAIGGAARSARNCRTKQGVCVTIAAILTGVAVKRGISLKEAEVAKALMDCDVFIDIPIAKHHDGVLFTGALKNMMGSLSQRSLHFFHFSTGGSGYYDDVEFLAQCIADFNLVRKPDLCVFDATEMITTNGPFGPGKLVKPQTVFAGVDRVAVDVYGANLLGVKGDEILITRMAHQHGLGEINLSKLQVQEVAL
jgi:uncharacterized protein (DUF362 family)